MPDGSTENGKFRPRVNGVLLEPTDDFGNGNAMGIACPTTTPFACSGGAHWWLDLDAAEAAHPGRPRSGWNQAFGVESAPPSWAGVPSTLRPPGAWCLQPIAS